jgi:Fibronectin type III domain/Interferon-alpha/beta receptor, fibronectin type III
MGDSDRVGTYSRFLTRVGHFLVLVMLIGFPVRPSSLDTGFNLNAVAASTQTPGPSRLPPPRVITPVVLTARAVSTSQINLSWTNNSDNVAGLYVERSRSPKGPWKRVVNVPSNASSCANAALAAGTTYYYRVMANDSPYSNVASATTLSAATDGVPGHLTATTTSSNQIDLSWSENVGDITGFKIERCEGKGCSNFTEIASVAANPTSYQNTDLTALTSYSYRIRAYKESSHHAYSNIASASTSRSTVPPTVPQGLVANAVSSGQIILSWNSEAVDHKAAGYNVYQYGERIGSTVGTRYTVKRLTPNTQYCYSVQAFDNAGNNSFQSDIACATTKPDSNSQPENKPTPELR